MIAKTLQALFVALLMMSLVLVMSASNAYGQGPETGRIFGALSTDGASGGTDAYLTTPDPVLLPGTWSAALTATGSFPVPPFIEAGAIKNCGVGCKYNPYYSYADNNFNRKFFEFDNINLFPTGWYEYKDYYVGNNEWEAQFCDGTGCTVLIDVNLGISDGMPFEASGGESSNAWSSIGTATAVNQWWNIFEGHWSAYCWDTEQKNVGTLTPCGNNSDWSVFWLVAGRVLMPVVIK